MKKIILSILTLCLVYSLSQATTWNVSNTAQLKSSCTSAANGDIINILNDIALTEKLPAITAQVTIAGPANGATISGNNTFNIFDFNIPAGGSVVIRDLNLINGYGSGFAGGINAFSDGTGSITLERVTISNCSNKLNEYAYGGAIAVCANLNLINCTLSGNTAEDGGGAIADVGASDGFSISLINCTVTNNKSLTPATGGAFDIYSNISFTIKNSILTNNLDGNNDLLTFYFINPSNLFSQGYNLTDDNIVQLSQATDLKGLPVASIALSELLAHGTNHLTHLIGYNSIAKGIITPAGSYNGCPATDQRGLTRPETGDRCAGAIENLTPELSITTAESIVWNGATLKATITPYFHTLTNIKFEVGTSSETYTANYDANSTTVSGNSNVEVTATPFDLDPNQEYYVRVIGTWDYSLDFDLVGSETSFTTIYQPVFSIAIPGTYSWNNADTWEEGIIPDETCDVTIMSGVHVQLESSKISFKAHNLTLEPGAMLTNSNIFRISGDLLLKSNASASSSLVDNSAFIANGISTVELYIPQNDRFYYVSVPVSGVTASAFGDVANLDKLYYRNTATSTWVRLTDPDEELIVGRGYTTKQSVSGRTILLQGELVSGTQSVSIPFEGDRWALVGNPYPSPVDWGTANEPVAGWNNPNIYNKVYVKAGENFAIWNPAGNGGGTNGGSRYIPALQSFWIRSIAANAEVNFANTVRTHNGNLLMKNEMQTSSLSITVTRENFSDEILIRSDDHALNGYDDYDAYKMFASGNSYPQLYCMVEDKPLAINTFNKITLPSSIPLGFKTATAGEFTLKFKGFESFNDTYIFLFDKMENTLVRIDQNSKYIFTSDVTDNTNRFEIRFTETGEILNPDSDVYENGSTTGVKTAVLNKIFTFASGHQVFIKSEKAVQASIELFNVQGKQTNSAKMEGNECTIAVETSGVYIVKVISGEALTVTKVIVK